MFPRGNTSPGPGPSSHGTTQGAQSGTGQTMDARVMQTLKSPNSSKAVLLFNEDTVTKLQVCGKK